MIIIRVNLHRASRTSRLYPYFNESAEMQWEFNARVHDEYFALNPKTKMYGKCKSVIKL